MGSSQEKETLSKEDIDWKAATEGLFYVWNKEQYDTETRNPDKYSKTSVSLTMNENPPLRRKAASDRKYKVLKIRLSAALSAKQRAKMKFEDRALQCIQHPFVHNIHEAFQTPTGQANIVTEYCEGKDLKNLLEGEWVTTAEANTRQVHPQLEYDTILTWITQLALALEESHSLEIIHRNMDSNNVFLRNKHASQEEGKQQCARIDDEKKNLPRTELSAVLANFGNARAQAVAQATQATSSLGPVYYMSPENHALHVMDQEVKPGKKSDVWALGVLLAEMVMMTRIAPTTEKELVFGDSKDEEIQQLAAQFVKDAGDKFPLLRPIFDAILVNGRVKDDRPFASDLLQLEPIKSKVTELVADEDFKTELRDLYTKKLQFGFARPQEFEAIRALMEKNKAQKPREVLDEYLNEYILRVTLGNTDGKDRVRDKKNEGDLTIGDQKTKDWMMEEGKEEEQKHE